MIVQRDAFDLLGNVKDEEKAVIYCDPPYHDVSDQYLHNFKDQAHQQLATALKRFKAVRVLVSYYDHPELELLYKDWTRIYFEKKRPSLRNATRGKKKEPRKEQVEVLLINQKNSQQKLFENSKHE